VGARKTQLTAVFTWTMDGLGGFRVIPTPGSLGILAVGVALAIKRRRSGSSPVGE